MENQQIGALITLVGLLIALIGHGWLIGLSWKKSKILFAITLFFPFIYPFFDWKRAWGATVFTAIGVVLTLIGLDMILRDPEIRRQMQEILDQTAQ